jgi:methenyltetrahydromethanopterin cyclohydrolase
MIVGVLMTENEQEVHMDVSNWPSVNALTSPLVEYLVQNAKELRVGLEKTSNGATIIDAGINHFGSLEVGRLIAEICMGGLGHVSLQTSTTFAHWPWMLSVHSNNPTLSCLGSQYAGWSLAHEKFFSLGSGPGRVLAGREDLFKELGYQDQSNSACLVLESDKAPPLEVIEKYPVIQGLLQRSLLLF